MQLPFKPIPMIVVAGLSSLVGGALGVLLLMLMLLLTQASLGREEADKHGISENNASRMGGVAIAVGALMFCIPAVLTHSSVDLSKAPANLFRGYEWAPLLIGMIGLVDDITQRISPMNRLLTMLLIGRCRVLDGSGNITQANRLSNFKQIAERTIAHDCCSNDCGRRVCECWQHS